MSLSLQTGSKKNITIDAKKCNGCRTCELACSFHHTKTFDPIKSSIDVCRNDGEGTVEVSLIASCDGCPEEDAPFCVRFCSSGCLRLIS
jgi:Fe-S-cluster-containing dehydrogenase component